MNARLDPIGLTQDLIRCPSVTPDEAGALDLLQGVLEDLQFQCERMRFSESGTADVDNLFAQIGSGAPHFCFAGHIDVVPIGNEANWSVDPFAGLIQDGQIIGRGACDMKGAIAAFVAAVVQHLAQDTFGGTISLLISGDEEGPAINGTVKMLEVLRDRGIDFDHCLVGEPSNRRVLGDAIKIGRRGSYNGRLISKGAQGHVAYPHLADNPIPRLLFLLSCICDTKLDDGTEHFEPSNLEIVTIDTGNEASNVIPAEVSAGFNIRFNNLHTETSLAGWIESEIEAACKIHGGSIELHGKASGDAFLTEPCAFTDLVSRSIAEVTAQTPDLSTGGGTSDARFITKYCPVVELGLVGQSMHKADEHTSVQDVEALRDIYAQILSGYFGKGRTS